MDIDVSPPSASRAPTRDSASSALLSSVPQQLANLIVALKRSSIGFAWSVTTAFRTARRAANCLTSLARFTSRFTMDFLAIVISLPRCQ